MWRGIVLFLAITAVSATGGVCRILAVAGGTERGAYEAGAIMGLISNLPPANSTYDVVTGVGIGAVNALIVASYPQGQEAAAAAKLSSFWNSFTYSTVYKDWIGGLITGLLAESGLYDSTPLRSSIKALMPKKFGRWIAVGATDLLSGSYVVFNSSSQTIANMETGIYASATDPGILPIVTYNKLQLVSGHVKFAIDLLTAVNACEALGYSGYSNMYVHAILGAGLKLKEVEAINYKTLQVTMRYFEIAAFDSFMQVIENAQHDFPGINVEYQIYPSAELNRTLYPYDFTHQEIIQQINLGQSDAAKAVNSKMMNREVTQ